MEARKEFAFYFECRRAVRSRFLSAGKFARELAYDIEINELGSFFFLIYSTVPFILAGVYLQPDGCLQEGDRF
jgi:hypothetical protein